MSCFSLYPFQTAVQKVFVQDRGNQGMVEHGETRIHGEVRWICCTPSRHPVKEQSCSLHPFLILSNALSPKASYYLGH